MTTPPFPSAPTSRPTRDVRGELTSLAVAVGGIWTGVVAISLLAPDMVSGSEQQHLPIAAFTTWIWGTVATAAVLASAAWGRSRHRAGAGELHRPLAVVVAAVWLVAAAVAVLSPEMVTGSDPTRIPIAAFLAPIAATVLTVVVRAGTAFVAQVLDDPGPAVPPPTSAPTGTPA